MKSACQLQELLTQHLLIAADLVNAAKNGETEKANSPRKKWYQNADEIANFLASINPCWNETKWKDMLYSHLEMTEKEAQARRNRWCTIDKYVHRQNMMSAGGSIAIALVAFCGAIYLAMNNHDRVAFGLVGSTLGVVVYAISRANK